MTWRPGGRDGVTSYLGAIGFELGRWSQPVPGP